MTFRLPLSWTNSLLSRYCKCKVSELRLAGKASFGVPYLEAKDTCRRQANISKGAAHFLELWLCGRHRDGSESALGISGSGCSAEHHCRGSRPAGEISGGGLSGLTDQWRHV